MAGSDAVPDNWSTLDVWRSTYEALALVNGDDPKIATARHRDWCIKQGFEPANTERDNG